MAELISISWLRSVVGATRRRIGIADVFVKPLTRYHRLVVIRQFGQVSIAVHDARVPSTARPMISATGLTTRADVEATLYLIAQTAAKGELGAPAVYPVTQDWVLSLPNVMRGPGYNECFFKFGQAGQRRGLIVEFLHFIKDGARLRLVHSHDPEDNSTHLYDIQTQAELLQLLEKLEIDFYTSDTWCEFAAAEAARNH